MDQFHNLLLAREKAKAKDRGVPFDDLAAKSDGGTRVAGRVRLVEREAIWVRRRSAQRATWRVECFRLD